MRSNGHEQQMRKLRRHPGASDGARRGGARVARRGARTVGPGTDCICIQTNLGYTESILGNKTTKYHTNVT